MIRQYPEIESSRKIGANLYLVFAENTLSLEKAAEDISKKGYKIINTSPVTIGFFDYALITIEQEC